MPQVRRRLAPDVRIEDLSDSDADEGDDELINDAHLESEEGDEEEEEEEVGYEDEDMLLDSDFAVDDSDMAGDDSDSSYDDDESRKRSKGKGKGKEPETPKRYRGTERSEVTTPTTPSLRPRPESAKATKEFTTKLLSLPDELLITVVSCLGRSASRPRSAPWPFFMACRRLYNLSRDTLTRTEFLIGNFGIRGVLQGCWSWFKLTTPEVMKALLNRAGNNVPRYILQRLARRCANANRTDLLPLVAEHGKSLYPPNTTASLAFSADTADETIFEQLLSATAVPEHLSYLVTEAKRGGWYVADDPVMSALLSLKELFGFDFNLTAPGEIEEPPYLPWDAPADFKPRTDVGVEGLNHGFALLVSVIRNRHTTTVSRLLRLGVHLIWSQGPAASFFADCLAWARRQMDIHDSFYGSRQPFSDYISYSDQSAGKHIVDKLFTNETPEGTVETWPGDAAVLQAQCDRFHSEFYSVFAPSALHAAVLSMLAWDDTMIKLVFGHVVETGWIATPLGLETVKSCKRLALRMDGPHVVPLIQSYWNAIQGTDKQDFELVTALCKLDFVAAKVLIDSGKRLDMDELVLMLESNRASQAREFLSKNYPFTKESLSAALTRSVSQVNALDRYGMVSTVNNLLKTHRHIIDEESARALAMQWFNRPNLDDYQRKPFRRIVGPARPGDPQSLLRFDLKEAIRNGSVLEVLQLNELGVKVPSNAIKHYFTRKCDIEVFKSFVNGQNYNATDINRLLLAKIRPRWEIADWLLSRPVLPVVDSALLRNCMVGTKAAEALPLFCKLLDIAKTQSKKMEKPGQLRSMVQKRGGQWEKAWKEYEAKVR